MSTHRPRILIIDDDPLYRSLMTTLLRKDYLLAVASEGSEGYQKALQHPPDIAIIDIQMSGWDGLKTLEQFRKNPILKRVKIVMLTGDASKESVVAAIRSGANDYVIKTSFSREEFREKLRRLSQKQSQPVVKQPVISADRPFQKTPTTNEEAKQTLSHVDAPANSTPAPVGGSPESQKPHSTSENIISTPDDESNTDLQTMIDSWD